MTSYFKTRYHFIILICLLILPLATKGSYFIYLAELFLLYSIAAIGLAIFVANTNRLSFAQSALMGLSAYITAITITSIDIDSSIVALVLIGLTILISTVITVVIGSAVVYPALKMKGAYFAMVTIAVAWIFWRTVIEWVPLTGGELGIREVYVSDTPSIYIQRILYLIYAVFFFLAIRLYIYLSCSSFGLLKLAYREDPICLASIGIRDQHFCLLLFLLSSLLAGIAGGMFAIQQGFVNPDSFKVFDGVSLLLAILIGGTRSIYGPVLGVAVIFILPEFFHGLDKYRLLFYGFFILLVLNIKKEGILPEYHGQVWRKRPTRVGVRNSVHNSEAKEKPDFSSQSFEIKNVSRSFGTIQALNDVSLEIASGRIHGVIGSNGSGKTTLVDVISGYVKRDSGSILLNNKEVSVKNMDQVARIGIQRTFQKIRNFESLTCRENLLAAIISKKSHGSFFDLAKTSWSSISTADEVIVEETLENFQLENWCDELSNSLPQGRRRLLELARSIVTNPKLLLLDEPTSGLDESEVLVLQKAINIFADTGALILVVDHNPTFISAICSDVTVLNQGKVIASGSPIDVYQNPDVLSSYGSKEIKC